LNANDSQYIKPHRIHYKLNGRRLTWDAIKVHDSVAIILFNKSSHKLVFVRQFRPAVFMAYLCKSVDSNVFSKDNIDKVNQLLENDSNLGYTIELCAGIIDKEGKDAKEIAMEEVEEETGYKVHLDSLKFISSFRSGVGVSGSLLNLYYCEITDETPKGKGGGIGDEQIEVIELTVEEAKKLLFCEDRDAMLSRPAGLLFGLSWFLFEYLPQI